MGKNLMDSPWDVVEFFHLFFLSQTPSTLTPFFARCESQGVRRLTTPRLRAGRLVARRQGEKQKAPSLLIKALGDLNEATS